jgi:hypothetical protein
LKWIDEHPQADKDDYEKKRKELEELWRPIITAAYGQGGAGGMPGGMPNMGDFGQGPSEGGDTSGGPKIDEVD